MVMKIGDDSVNVANPRILEMQTHEVTVDGDLYKRDGINYLVIDQVVNDQGIVKVNHELATPGKSLRPLPKAPITREIL